MTVYTCKCCHRKFSINEMEGELCTECYMRTGYEDYSDD